MARVLFYTGIIMLILSAILLYLPTCFSIILAVLFGLATIFLIVFKNKIMVKGLTALFIICFCFLLVGVYNIFTLVKPAENLSGYKAEVVGTVTNYPEYFDGYTVYEVKTEKITPITETLDNFKNNYPENIKLRLTDVNSLDLRLFEKVRVEVTFNPLNDFRSSSLSNGVYASGYINKLYERLGNNPPFYAPFYYLHNYINDIIYDNLNYKEATVVSAILIGDLTRLDSAFYDNAKVTGVSHVLVVSGMHLGIIFQVLFGLLGFLKISNKTKSLLLMSAVFVICAVCGFTPSILRAGLTYFIMAFGIFIFRRPDPLNSLGAATVIILFFSPFGIGNVSLMLSLLSTFGLLFACPFIYDKICYIINKYLRVGRLLKGVVFSFCQTISASIFTAPICVIYFGYLSLISPITNLLIGYATTLILGLSLLAVVILMLPSVLKTAATLPIIAICLLVRYTVWVINSLAKVKWAIISTEPYFLIFIFIVILFLSSSILINKYPKIRVSKVKLISLITAFTVAFSVLGTFLYVVTPHNRLAALRVGKGTAVVLSYENEVVLIGAGDTKSDAKTIKNYLLSIGKTEIDYLILPSLVKEFTGGAPELIKTVSVKTILHTSSGKYYSKIEHISDERFCKFDKKSKLTLNSGKTVTTYSDGGAVINFGDFSAVVYYNSFMSFDIVNSENNLLICMNNIEKSFLNNRFSKFVISGSADNVNKIKQSNNAFKNAANCVDKHWEYKIY